MGGRVRPSLNHLGATPKIPLDNAGQLSYCIMTERRV